MRLLIVHLSDIHLTDASNPILGRASKIADAVKSRRYNVDRVILAVTGDIAFSGEKEQYCVATSLIKQIAQDIGDNPLIVIVPGNHDCDFSEDTTAREMLLNAIRQDPSSVDNSVAQQCLSVQDSFFSFRDSIATTSLTQPGKLYYEYSEIIAGDKVVLRCYDTAWLSQRKEKQGSLIFPDYALQTISKARFAVSLFHHPYNWHSPDRHFRRTVERRSDLVLTGHEHEHDRQVSYRPDDSKSTTYIEGSALQHSDDPNASAFSAILVDVTERMYQLHHFQWNGTYYAPTSDESAWEPLILESHLFDEPFEPARTHIAWLTDPGIPNPNKTDKQRALQDIFLYPDLIEWFRDPALRQTRKTIKSEDVFQTIKQFREVYLLAPPKAGRTSLAKQLILDFLDDGFVPLYLDAVTDRLRVSSDEIPTCIISAVKAQYGQASVEPFRQLDANRRVIIVDNLDRAKENASTLEEFFTHIRGLSACLIVLGDDVGGRITELIPAVEGPAPTHKVFQIRPLGARLRERLAQQWFQYDDPELDETSRSRRLEDIARILNTLIGRNYVPAFPLFIVAVLQAYEQRAHIDMRASTHGYFYDLLIRLALAGDTTADFGVRIEFLTHVAYEMFERKVTEVLEKELKESFDRYQEKHRIGRLEYTALINVLVARGLLSREGDTVRFKYPYLFYYFVANKLKSNISTPEAQAQITDLTANLADQQSSDILMFLAHLSNDVFILQELLNAANALYAGLPMATLESKELSEAPSDLALTYLEKPINQTRLHRAGLEDQRLESAEQADHFDSDSQVGTSRVLFASALHTIRILGQILRSFPGTLDAEWKITLTRACYALGLRTLSFFLSAIKNAHKETLEAVLNELRKAYPGLPEDKIKAKAEQYLWFWTVLSSFTLLRLVSNAIAAPELELIYDDAFSTDQTAAVKLLEASLQMYVSNGFPIGLIRRFSKRYKDKLWPLTVMRLFAVEHFERMEVPIPTRRSVCSLLGIEYRALPPGT